MPMVVHLPDEIEDAVSAAARRLGVTPEGFVIEALRARLAEETRDRASASWKKSLHRVGSPAGISLSDEATSRESLYD
jgi:hypothetical protein